MNREARRALTRHGSSRQGYRGFRCPQGHEDVRVVVVKRIRGREDVVRVHEACQECGAAMQMMEG